MNEIHVYEWKLLFLQFSVYTFIVLLFTVWNCKDVRQEMINIIVNNVQIIHHIVARIFKRLMFIQVKHTIRCRSLSPFLHSYIL